MTPFALEHPCATCPHTYEEHDGLAGCTAEVHDLPFPFCPCVEFEPVPDWDIDQ